MEWEPDVKRLIDEGDYLSAQNILQGLLDANQRHTVDDLTEVVRVEHLLGVVLYRRQIFGKQKRSNPPTWS